MTEPFLGEIRLVSFIYPPQGWALCNGQTLPINQNQVLFSLLGTTYGGDGRVNFALPDLRGRLPMHVGNGHVQGERAGEAAHTLTVAELPAHTHVAHASAGAATTESPAGVTWAATATEHYGTVRQVAMHAAGTSPAGGSQPHLNMPPYLTLTFVIALQGIFPPRP